ncbi:MAG TPA: FHA domain-containing protein [Kofleriaceae bacterium]|nr:FHA domain-containing protein [Kofleriaceae bacterium]
MRPLSRIAVLSGGLLVLAATLFGINGTARGQQMKLLDLKLVEPPSGDKKAKPVYRAKLDYSVPGLPADKFELKDIDADPPVSVPASALLSFPDSDDKMALVVLIQGDELWMGNETYVTDDEDILQGAFAGLAEALESLAKMGPVGSTGSLLVYAGGSVTVKYPMGDVTGLSSALGTQRDYKEAGVPLIVGVDEAYKALTEASGRRVLVIFGDGTGEREDISKELAERVDKLKKLGVETFSIYFTTTPTDNTAPKKNMRDLGYSGEYEAAQRDNFKSKAEDIGARISARYYLDFPADAFATKDKSPRELAVAVGDDEAEWDKPLATLALPKPPEESSLWWLWLLIVLVVLILIVVIVIKIKNREPAPPPVFEAPPPEPISAAPQKTIMLGIGGDDEGFPIVGWVVPLTGPNQYQTFKLLQGQTVLGTGGTAHVVVNDTFMSTEHAQIICSPVGFILQDGGSTNGTLVNQRRIDKHELVDNDVFTLGKTDFKFKSIN